MSLSVLRLQVGYMLLVGGAALCFVAAPIIYPGMVVAWPMDDGITLRKRIAQMLLPAVVVIMIPMTVIYLTVHGAKRLVGLAESRTREEWKLPFRRLKLRAQFFLGLLIMSPGLALAAVSLCLIYAGCFVVGRRIFESGQTLPWADRLADRISDGAWVRRSFVPLSK